MLAFLHQGNATTNTQALVQLDVTPTVDPSATPTETPTVTPTTTPEVTPTDVPTATPTVTLTITPTVTPTVTPSVTPCAPEQENDKDDMLGLKADAHAFFGLVNAAFHHEKNEARFEAKHCEQVEVERQGGGE